MDDFSKLSDDELRAIAGLAPGAAVPPPKKPWSASILPLSEDAKGGLQFDSNAGIMGGFKRAFMLPGEVAQGKVDPSSPEGIGRVTEMGMAVSPANPAVRAGANFAGSTTLSGTKPPAPKAPSREALYSASDEGYANARGLGVEYSPEAIAEAMKRVRADLDQKGMIAEITPGTETILGKLTDIPKVAPGERVTVPFTSLEAARRAAREVTGDFKNPTDQKAARSVISGIDEFVEAGDPRSVVAGPASAISQIAKDARGNYAAGARSEDITGIEKYSLLRAVAANSGRNLDNTLRQRIADLFHPNHPERLAGFAPDEVKLLEKVVVGNQVRNRLRDYSNMAGGGGGVGASVVGGLAGSQTGSAYGTLAGALMGLGIPASGMAARTVGGHLTRKAIGTADEATRKRSPLYDAMVRDAPPDVVSPEARAALIRALMQAQQEQQQ